MAEEEIVIQPIKTYDNYVTLSNKVMGVIPGGFEEIPLIQGLFKIDGVLFFTIDDKPYMQDGNEITEFEPADFPTGPVSENINFNSVPFKIETFDYKGTDTSRVYKTTAVEAYMQIDGACMRGDDLLFSVSIESPGREKGVYLWAANSGGTLRKFDTGRIW